jgi:alpha-L-fucosidase 2
MSSPSTIWFREPAQQWCDALPVGNGRLGGMLYGGLRSERIYLSDITFWSGEPSTENNNSDGPAIVAEVRRRLLAGDFAGGNELAHALEGRKLNYGTNLPVGNLRLFLDHADDALRNYRRALDLDRAVAEIRYTIDGVTYQRELFASHVDGVLVLRLTVDQPGKLGLRIGLDGDEQPFHSYTKGDGLLCMDVQAREPVHSDGQCGVDGHVRVQVLHEGGTLTTQPSQIVVVGSDAVTVLLAFSSTFDTTDPAQVCLERVTAAAATPYADLKARHIADHQALFRRVELDLGASPQPEGSVNERIAAVKAGASDPALVALLFQFGRYLLIGASRPDSPLPAHLLGVWNDNVAARIGWTCDYHLDINTQMNYWIAELTNLRECHQPLLRWIAEDLVPSGRATARTLYGLPGWVAHIFSNAWAFSAPGWSTWWGLHPTGGVWVATHLWDHYLFGGNREFLADHAYPVLKEAAEFFLAYLLEDPQTGWLLSGPANSPENVFIRAGGRYPVALAPTADRILIHELFSACIAASEILAIDEELRTQLVAARAKLPPFQIGNHGQLQEWLDDDEEALPHHRHTSHLLSVFPFAQITPTATPALADAVKVSIARREAGPFEEGSWGRNLITLYHARLGDAAAAYASLQTLFAREGDRSLMMGTNLAPRNAYELDYNTGATAGIAEMLLQSHQGYLHLLPALPAQWPNGQVRGLCGRGGFTVDVAWQAGQLVTATIHAERGGCCQLRTAQPVTVHKNDQAVPVTSQGAGTVVFMTEAGSRYTIQS